MKGDDSTAAPLASGIGRRASGVGASAARVVILTRTGPPPELCQNLHHGRAPSGDAPFRIDHCARQHGPDELGATVGAARVQYTLPVAR